MFLTQAHIPVLNVKYDKDACGPFRDWQDEETNFVANGKEIAPGILMANEPPKTILDLNQDGGNFHGVAVSIEGDEIVLTSELQSGWYRYVPQWRFHKDGTLKARFSFTAVRNACVCNIHHHHVYWRFKLAGNTSVQERSNNLWTNISTEAKRFRTSPSVSWRALYAPEGNSKPSLTFVPGSQDNTATGDAYAVADAWFLKRQDGESSDGIASSGTPSQKTGISIDRFLNDESLQDTSVVVWYGAHFNHDILEGESHDDTGGHTVGPDLILTP